MYINFEYAEANGLSPNEIIALQIISQNKYENKEKVLEKTQSLLDIFEAKGLVKYIKGNKKDSKYKLVRLSEKGAQLLENIQIPEITDDDLNVFKWLEKKYIESGKEIGNSKKTKLYLAQFRVHSGIERNHLVYLCKVFMNDEKEMEYSKKLEYLFFKPANAFSVKFDINQSRLYQYYLKHKDKFDKIFSQLPN